MDILTISIPFVLTLIITPFAIKISHRRNFLDHPKANSVHTKPIPMAGGLVIFFAFFVTTVLLKNTYNMLPFFAGAAIVVMGGIYDDLKGMNAQKKLLIQTISVIVLSCFGITISKIRFPFTPIIELGLFSVPLTILWFLVMINLINIIDGLDGLAAGLSAIVLFATAFFAQPHSIYLQILTLLSATLSFLLFNFYPAKIFLGNSGSSLLGFSIAYFLTITSQKSTMIPILILPCTVLSFYIFDSLYAIIRRRRQGRSVFTGDKEHIHHLMLSGIKNHRLVVLIFYLSSLVISLIVLNLIRFI